MTQASLTEEAAKVAGDARETSRLAALKARPRSGTIRQRVLEALVVNGGMTDDELVQFLRIPGNTVRPRRLELVEGEWVQDSGRRRRNEFGNDCIVWSATEKARK